MALRKLKIISEELFHKVPRMKPPRFDLRKRKILNDPDFKDISEEEDEDLKEKD